MTLLDVKKLQITEQSNSFPDYHPIWKISHIWLSTLQSKWYALFDIQPSSLVASRFLMKVLIELLTISWITWDIVINYFWALEGNNKQELSENSSSCGLVTNEGVNKFSQNIGRGFHNLQKLALDFSWY